jgi:protein-S-isoprenylcysteine O-methyltransferase Ste14
MHWLRDQLPDIITGACIGLILVFLPRKVRLWLQGLIFTILVPGVVAFYVPQALRNGHAAAEGWWSLGWFLFAIGAAIYSVCLFNFLAAGGTPAIFFTRHIRTILGEEPKEVVRNGLYRYSRNPMYVGVITAIAGQTIVYRSSRISIYLVIAIVFFHCVVVFLEEPHLSRARGPAYDNYRRRVPRWLGLPRSSRTHIS